MNRDLALKTLGELLEWTNPEAGEEFAWLTLMSTYKYDGYQGYEPGFHFLESLVGWLLQFDNKDDRRTAYSFVRNKLVFFSREEIYHLVQQYSASLRKYFLQQFAAKRSVKPYEAMRLQGVEEEIRKAYRKSLFVGLSDGARMDVFRRHNEEIISNEQIVVGPDISSEKWESMTEKLGEDIKKNGWDDKPLFENIFLIDDFTASGTTLLVKKDGPPVEWGGKIKRFVKSINSHFDTLIASGASLNAHHYIASEVGVENVGKAVLEFGDVERRLKVKVSFGYVIPASLRISATNNPELVRLLSAHYDKEIETESLRAGGDARLGYKGGALPVVIEHNTPNNSIALLWAESKTIPVPTIAMRPLFLRRQRHM